MPDNMDFDDIVIEMKKQKAKLPKLPFKGKGGVILLVILVLVVLGTGYYQVEPNETAVVLRFGKFLTTASPGPHLKAPFGIDRVYKVKTDYQFKQEFGFRTARAGIRTQYVSGDFTDESNMLTGDLNIATVTWVVQYRIRDAKAYLFNVRGVVNTLRDASEAAMRAVVGDESFNEVLQLKRQETELDAKQKLQRLLDMYGCGITVKLVQLQDVHPPTPVKDSFDEVNRARQEMDQAINEAYQQYNKVIYRVKGEAEQMVKEAEGRKVERINEARGDAEFFLLQLAAFRKAPEVTRRRLFLETMQKILPKLRHVYVIDQNMKGMVPLLDLRGGGSGGAK
ncbi:MAG: FtsH protease activity modulator HflK [Acidobacteria bacterium]|nr:FtsH protease activity modulator HflK [Acidobacteriota bacterium]